MRHGVTHDVLACWFDVDRFTATRAIGEVRPLFAERGCTVSPGLRLRTLAEVVNHLSASRKTGVVDGTQIQVRRPAAGRKGRDNFVSGKNKQNAVKTMVVTSGDGRVPFCSPTMPGSCADITHARQLGLAGLLIDGPAMEILADASYQGFGSPDQRTCGHNSASHVQEERSGLVRGNARAAAQSALLTTQPCRATASPI
nr:transposase [Streptomyces sp. SID685]